ncbi:MAG: hypothetical protein EXS38_07655 [Opitutus sp.]|nr:hypothetical protein [Opitutus sp.]
MLAAVTPVQMGFPHAATVVAVQSTVTDKKTGLTSSETRLFVSSAPRAAFSRRQWLARCRGHWSVESANHYRRDVTWQEDRELGRNPRRACNLALLRSALLGVIRSVRTRDWKYIRNLHPEFQYHTHMSRASGPHRPLFWDTWLAAAKAKPSAAAVVNRYIEHPAEELYNLAADPFELHNLAADSRHGPRLAELDAWLKQQGDAQTVFGQPLLRGEPVTDRARDGAQKKRSP